MSSFLDRISKLPFNKLALLAAELQEKLEAEQSAARQPVAIIGVGCRLPGGGDSVETFAEMLAKGTDAIEEVETFRWDAKSLYDPDPDALGKTSSRWGGFLKNIDLFDPGFFGIAPREAQRLDPQHRMLLETSWEALERACIAPSGLTGTNTGVFIGLSNNDYGAMLLSMPDDSIDAYTASGAAHSVAAGRLSYFYGLKGPSMAIDTACSSSGVAIHLASRSLRHRECDLALAGGVNLLLSAQTTIALSKSHMLAADGRCKTFSAEADGFVRSEGCGILVLKRLADALAEGDRIVGVIRGTACNQDGRSSGLTAPNGPSQEAVIRAAMKDAGVTAADIGYVEAHGTGTALGDPIEVGALANVFAKGRGADGTGLAIGSVKANVGHLESAAAVAGVIKVLGAFATHKIPPQLHTSRLNPRIAWETLPFVVSEEARAWNGEGRKRVAGVSSFGFSGTNVHLVLEAPPEAGTGHGNAERPCYFLPISAKSDAALSELCRRYLACLDTDPEVAIADLCYSAAFGRSHFSHRFGAVVRSVEEAAAVLGNFIANSNSGPNYRRGDVPDQTRSLAAYYFTGQAPADSRKLVVLYDQAPPFREAFDQCSKAAEALSHYVLTKVFKESDERPLRRDVGWEACFNFAVEYSLAELWQAWGIEPGALITQESGAYAAACFAGVMSLSEGLLLARTNVMGKHQLADVARSITYSDPQILITVLDAPLTDITTVDGWIYQPIHSEQTPRTPDAKCLEQCRAVLQLGTSDVRPYRPESLGWHESVSAREEAWETILNSLAGLYVKGFLPNWKSLEGAQSRNKILLPTYPFERTRHWIDKAERASPMDNQAAEERVAGRPLEWLYSVKWAPLRAGAARNVSPREVVARIDASQEAQTPPGAATYKQFQNDINALCTEYIVAAMDEIGFVFQPGSVIPTYNGDSDGRVISRHHRLWNRLLQLLGEAGVLTKNGLGWRCNAEVTTSPVEGVLELNRKYPHFEAEVEFLQQARHLGAVLQGKLDPLEALFPNGSLALAERVYQEGPAARFFNEAVASAVREVSISLPSGKPIRVLEIGAGTGSATAFTLRELASLPCQYLFTDVSNAFLANARQKFSEYSFVQFALLDVENRRSWQGIELQSFDLIVAANVLHATENLRNTLRNVRDLLAPEGYLVVLEGTTPQPFGDLTVGMTEGWWRFTDFDLRPDYPLLAKEQWLTLLAEEGFDAAAMGAEHGDDVLWSQQSLFVAGKQGRKRFLLCGGGEYAQWLRSSLEGQGQDAEVIEFPSNGGSNWESLLLEAKAKNPRPASLVYLGALDHSVSNGELSRPSDTVARLSVELLNLMQAETSARASSEIWVVSRGAQAFEREQIVIDGAALWGLVRTTNLELPELKCRCLDIDHDAPSSSVDGLAEVLIDGEGHETGLMIRRQETFGARLSNYVVQESNPRAEFAIDKEGAYLLTGAFGGLGPAVAAWLVAQGARNLFLVGRRMPPTSVRASLSDWEQQGVRVHVLQADVAEYEDMSGVFAKIAESGAQLKGVFHLAGVLHDKTIQQQSAESFTEVLRPKLDGAWWLHKFSAGYKLDCFVMFASAASVMGAAGQANHAAANACLDALAHFRRANGLPATSIDWGPWCEIGAASSVEKARGESRGVSFISPRQGIDLLRRILQENLSQVAVLPIDWEKYLRTMRGACPPFLQELEGARTNRYPTRSTSEAAAAELDLSLFPIEQRPQLIRGYVRRRVAHALQVADDSAIGSDEPLSELGLDSLMALELKNELQKLVRVALPSDLFFRYPTIDSVSTFLEAVIVSTSATPLHGLVEQEEIAL